MAELKCPKCNSNQVTRKGFIASCEACGYSSHTTKFTSLENDKDAESPVTVKELAVTLSLTYQNLGKKLTKLGEYAGKPFITKPLETPITPASLDRFIKEAANNLIAIYVYICSEFGPQPLAFAKVEEVTGSLIVAKFRLKSWLNFAQALTATVEELLHMFEIEF